MHDHDFSLAPQQYTKPLPITCQGAASPDWNPAVEQPHFDLGATPPRRWPHNTPGWIVSLQAFWDEFADTEMLEQGPVAYVRTWLITEPYRRRSFVHRMLRLDQDSIDWYRQIQDLWIDLLDPGTIPNIYMVQPLSPFNALETYTADVIITQHQQATDRATLLVLRASTALGMQYLRCATFLPVEVRTEDISPVLADFGHSSLDTTCEYQGSPIVPRATEPPVAIHDGGLFACRHDPAIAFDSMISVAFTSTSSEEALTHGQDVDAWESAPLLEMAVLSSPRNPGNHHEIQEEDTDRVTLMQRDRSRSRNATQDDSSNDEVEEELHDPAARSSTNTTVDVPDDWREWRLITLSDEHATIHLPPDVDKPTIQEAAVP